MEQIACLILWPAAIVAAIDTIWGKAIHGSVTDDFRPVYSAVRAFLDSEAVYTAELRYVDPHYLYPPGGTLLLSPLGLFDEPTGRLVFLFANVAAAVVGVAVLLRVFGYSHRSLLAPVCYLVLFTSEGLINTVTFGNINGLFLLAEAVFLALLLHRHDLAAGVVLGLTIAIKPILAPLLLIALVRRQWSTVAAALTVPVAATALAWPLAADPGRYFVHNLPYSLAVRDYFNSSISGFGAYHGLHPAVVLTARAVVAVIVATSLWLLYRQHLNDELMFVCTATGVLLTGEFVLSSLGQQYYSLFLLPFLLTVVRPRSVLRNWPAWLAVFGFLTYDKWLLYRFPALGRDLEYSRALFGWVLLLVVVFCVLGDHYLTLRRNERLPGNLPTAPPPGLSSPDRPRKDPACSLDRRAPTTTTRR